MTDKKKTDKKERSKKYEKKLAVKGGFMDIIAASVKNADNKSAPKKQS